MMKKLWKRWMAGVAAGAILLTGCGQAQSSDVDETAGTQVESVAAAEEGKTEAGKTEAEGKAAAETETFVIGDTEVTIDAEDHYTAWSDEDAVYIHLDDTAVSVEGDGAEVSGKILSITDGGVYVLSGTWSDGSVQINAKDKGTVRLVLNGVEIHSEDSAAIYVMEADQVVISLEDGTVNTLSDSAGLVYTDTENEEPNAVLFSKADLTINGTGKLVIEAAFDHAVNGKDELILMSGEYQITSAGSAWKGKDLLVVMDGSYEITAGNDGLHSDGGLAILGGSIHIAESEEGIEGGIILIEGGDISLKSSDDGVNAASDEDITPALYINGGTLIVDAGGDGIDSNGDIYMTGGSVTIHGPENSGDGALDYDGIFEISGGSIAAFGMSGMAQTPKDSSAQSGLMMTYSERQPAGTEVVLTDESGLELYRGTAQKEFDSVVISVPELTEGETYVLNTGGESLTFVLESTVTYLNKDGVTEGGRMGRTGGKGEMQGEGGRRGERPAGESGEPPMGDGKARPADM